MKHFLFAFFFFPLTASCQWWSAEPLADTLHGIAIVLRPGGVVTVDSVGAQPRYVPQGILVPVEVFCVSERSGGVGQRFFDAATRREVDANDVLMFKIRDNKQK